MRELQGGIVKHILNAQNSSQRDKPALEQLVSLNTQDCGELSGMHSGGSVMDISPRLQLNLFYHQPLQYFQKKGGDANRTKGCCLNIINIPNLWYENNSDSSPS
jgi:hypothetical protein